MRTRSINLYLFIAFLLLSSTQNLSAQADTWVKGGGGSFNELTEDIITDNSGNIYVIGNFRDSLFFESQTLISPGANSLFVGKFDENGNTLWFNKYGKWSDTFGRKLHWGTDNQLWVIGEYRDSTILGADTLRTPYDGPNTDVIFFNLDPSNGVYDTVRVLGASGSEFGVTMVSGADSSKYIAGQFRNRVFIDFQDTLENRGIEDAYLVKFDKNLEFEWARSFGGNRYDGITDIELYQDSLVWVLGYFMDTTYLNWDSTEFVISQGEKDLIVAQYNSSGKLNKYFSGGSTEDDLPTGFAVTPTGDLYFTASYDSTFSWGTASVSSNGRQDALLMKLSGNGTPVWSRSEGGIYLDRFQDLALSLTGDVIVTGYFTDEVILANNDTIDTGSEINQDIWLMKYDATGTILWHNELGGITLDEGRALAEDVNGNIFVTGIFNQTLKVGQEYITSNGGDDFFIFRAEENGKVSLTPDEKGLNSLLVYPNPAKDQLFFLLPDLSNSGEGSITLFDLQGKQMVAKQIPVGISQVEISLETLSPGIYIYQVTQGKSKYSGKIIRQ